MCRHDNWDVKEREGGSCRRNRMRRRCDDKEGYMRRLILAVAAFALAGWWLRPGLALKASQPATVVIFSTQLATGIAPTPLDITSYDEVRVAARLVVLGGTATDCQVHSTTQWSAGSADLGAIVLSSSVNSGSATFRLPGQTMKLLVGTTGEGGGCAAEVVVFGRTN